VRSLLSVAVRMCEKLNEPHARGVHVVPHPHSGHPNHLGAGLSDGLLKMRVFSVPPPASLDTALSVEPQTTESGNPGRVCQLVEKCEGVITG
jgi:hypothetical protein